MGTPVTVTPDALWTEKDKDAVKVYKVGVGNHLAPGDRLVSALWTSTPSGGVEVVSSQFDDTSAIVELRGGVENTWYAVTCSWVSNDGVSDQFTLRVFVKEDAETSITQLGSPLFPNKFAAIAKMRRDRLMMLAASALPGVEVSDDYIWDRLKAAEAFIAHELRVPLAPTRFFSLDPSQDQVDQLAGKPWALDPPYDWEPENFLDSKWGYLLLRNKPVIEVHSIRVAYPDHRNTVLDVPADWVRLDKKYGHVNLVPASPMAMQTFGATLMPMISAGRRLPFSVHIDYTAGIQNVSRAYPDVLDAAMKQAAIGILEDAYLPQSGSISADGLSQSMSRDVSKYYDSVDRILHGSGGANGGLVAHFHGIRTMVV